MKLPLLCVLSMLLITGCGSVAPQSYIQNGLSTIPSDPHQAASPNWVSLVDSGPFAKIEIDLNSIQQESPGTITVWQRDTYSRVMKFGQDYSYKYGDSHSRIDCSNGTFAILDGITRKENGDVARVIPANPMLENNPVKIRDGSEQVEESKLVCDQAKHNWPGNSRYELHIWPQEVQAGPIAPDLTSENKDEIRQRVEKIREDQKKMQPLATPSLAAQTGKNICQPMNGADGSVSSFDLCVANGMFSHDVYDLQVGGISITKGVDDQTTTGIKSLFHGNEISLKCIPINQLANDVTAKTIEDSVNGMRKSMGKFSFEDRMNLAIRIHTVEVGRHCTLTASTGSVAMLDISFP